MSRPVHLFALAMLLPIAAWAQPLPPGNAEKGAQVFKTCAICHNLGPDAKIKVGPPLNGAVGRPVASWPGYSYSPALEKLKGTEKTWTEAALDKWLDNPRAVAPGTKMIFPGLKQPQQRADVIAYLKQFDEKGNKK